MSSYAIPVALQPASPSRFACRGGRPKALIDRKIKTEVGGGVNNMYFVTVINDRSRAILVK